MRDNKSGFVMSFSLLLTALLAAIAAIYVFFRPSGAIVNLCMILIALPAMLLMYTKGIKPASIWALASLAVLVTLCAIFAPAQLWELIFWLVWTPLALFCSYRLRMGVNGVFAERDFYRAECARIAMTDSVTQMRNMHAYLNDAPIYIKIAKRYQLKMVVLAVRLVNIKPLQGRMSEVAYNEMLESVSRMLRGSVRLEDLAYFINNETGVWCITMFTHVDAIKVVIERLKKSLAQVRLDMEDDDPYTMDYVYGYSVFNDEQDFTPITLLQHAIDMAEDQCASPEAKPSA